MQNCWLNGWPLGKCRPNELARALQVPPVTDLGFATVDNQRGARTGTSEIIYGAGKTKEQIAGIVTSMLEACQRRVLVTRLDGEKVAGVSELLAAGGIAMEYDPVARLGMVGEAKEPVAGNGACGLRRNQRLAGCRGSGAHA